VRTVLLSVLVALLCAGVCTAVEKHALIIGIKYDDLLYGDRDAEAFRDFVRGSLGFPEGKIKYVVNEAASRTGVLRAIRDLGRNVTIDQNNGEDVMVFVYFSGHSITDESGQAFYLTSESDATIPSTGMNVTDFLNEIKNQIKSPRIVFFLDTCFAAAIGNQGRSRSVPMNANPVLDKVWKDYFPRNEGITGMGFLSSQANQKSWEDDEVKHGIFTYYLLRGLRGEADQGPTGNADGKVTAQELKGYLEKVVPKHAERMHRQQDPLGTLSFDGSLTLAAGLPDIDLSLGIYSEKIPKGLDKIREFVNTQKTISSVSFDSVGGYAITSIDGSVSAASSDVGDSVSRQLKVDKTSIPGSVWLHGPQSYLILYQSGKFHHTAEGDIPPAIVKWVKAGKAVIQSDPRAVRDVAFSPLGGGVLLYGASKVVKDGALPPALEAAIEDPHQQVNHIAIGRTTEWVMIYDKNKFKQENLPAEMLTTLRSLQDRDKSIQVVAFNPSTDGWVIVADR
jgi:hypothetical protein